jgi:hypothetical protein
MPAFTVELAVAMSRFPVSLVAQIEIVQPESAEGASALAQQVGWGYGRRASKTFSGAALIAMLMCAQEAKVTRLPDARVSFSVAPEQK